MVFDVSVALTWILYLALFPITFFWLRRAFRIIFKRDFSEVALRRGEQPAKPEKYAPYVAANNLICGAVTLATIIFVAMGEWSYNLWSAVAGSTIWIKFILDFVLRWQAHSMTARKKPEA